MVVTVGVWRPEAQSLWDSPQGPGNSRHQVGHCGVSWLHVVTPEATVKTRRKGQQMDAVARSCSRGYVLMLQHLSPTQVYGYRDSKLRGLAPPLVSCMAFGQSSFPLL